MKKSVAILLIAVFFTAQYARQLAYLECKLAAPDAVAAAKCDCEKETAIDKLAGKEIPPSKNHSHTSIDEFFSGPAAGADKLLPAADRTKPAAAYSNAEQAGNYDTPYHPPRV